MGVVKDSLNLILRTASLCDISADSDQVPSRVLDNLTSFFTPHNTRLYRILGSDWGWRRDG